MVAVALDMGDAEERDQSEILLHADPGPGGEILARHEVARAPRLRIELRHPRGVEQRLVEALAVLAGDPGIAERQRRRERVELAVGLVDDERARAPELLDRARQRHRPLDRLLDEQDGIDQARQRRRLAHAPPQLGDAFDIVILLVAVERRPIVAGRAIEHRRDAAEPIEIGGDVAADLELVVAAAIVARDLFERLRQAVVEALIRRLVRFIDRIEQADGVAQIDPGAGRKAGEKPRQIEARRDPA